MSNDSLYLTTQQSFNLQYITVILLILAFLVGSFSSKNLKKVKEAEAIVAEPIVNEPLPLEARASLRSVIHYSDLFQPGSTKLAQDKAKGLSLLLANHDLTAKIVTNLEFCGDEITDLCFAKEMEGIKKLNDFFLAENLPRASFQIFYSQNLKDTQAEVNFLTEANG